MTTTLAQRLAAHPRFRWHVAMRVTGRCRGDYPHLSDPATTGILLSRLEGSSICICLTTEGGAPSVYVDGVDYGGDSLGEAVAKALLAQWGAE